MDIGDQDDDHMVTCAACGHEQPDMGRGVACEECGAAMPDAETD